jgi:predicted P-loop ATPase
MNTQAQDTPQTTNGQDANNNGNAVKPLTQHHLDLLTARSIKVEVAVQHGLQSVDLGRLREHVKLGVELLWPHLPLHPVTGILIPYPACKDDIPRARVRSDHTEYSVPGPIDGSHHGETTQKVPRYICQAGVPVAPYITKQALAVAADTNTPIYITEAPLKALALVSHGLPAIGLGGVLAGAHDRDALKQMHEVIAHQELRRLRWKGRKAFVVFDAGLTDHDDHPGNPNVALGAAYVAKALSDLGAEARLVVVPYFHPQESDLDKGQVWRAEDQGPDDFIARHGFDAFTKLINESVSADPVIRMTEALKEIDEKDKPRVAGDLLRELFFLASLRVGGDLTLTAVSGITKKNAEINKTHLKEAVKTFEQRLVARAKEGQPEWKQSISSSSSGAVRPIRENVELCLRHDEGLKRLVSYDQFGERIVFGRRPPWMKQYPGAEEVKAGDPWTDVDDLRLAGYLAETFNLIDAPELKVRAAVTLVARDHAVHPVRAYLNALRWDGVNRLDSWLSTYFGAPASEYASKVGTWWLVSAVARIMIPGCKVDHTLILEGPQGLAKSSALRVLGGEWFSDADLGDLRSKEAALALAGLWIVELAEGEIFSRASTRALKAFVTKEFDDIIPKFSNLRSRMKRQSVFALTTNDDADYLTDPTGNRRWWPVRCTQIDLDGLRRERDQLWAEAIARFRNNEAWWPVTDEEKALCEMQQQAREAEDPWDDRLRAALASVTEYTTISELLTDTLTIPVPQQGRRERLRVAACLRRLGWTESGRSNDARRWARGPKAQSYEGPKPTQLRLVAPPVPIPDDEELNRIMGAI